MATSPPAAVAPWLPSSNGAGLEDPTVSLAAVATDALAASGGTPLGNGQATSSEAGSISAGFQCRVEEDPKHLISMVEHFLKYEPSRVAVYLSNKQPFSRATQRAVLQWRCEQEPRMDLLQLAVHRHSHSAAIALCQYFPFLEPTVVPDELQGKAVCLRNHPLHMALQLDAFRVVKALVKICPEINMEALVKLDYTVPHPFYVTPSGQLPAGTPTHVHSIMSALDIASLYGRQASQSYLLDNYISQLMKGRPLPLVVTVGVYGIRTPRQIYVDLLADDVRFPLENAYLQTMLRALLLGREDIMARVPFISEFDPSATSSRWRDIGVLLSNVDFTPNRKIDNLFIHTASFAVAAARAAHYGRNSSCINRVRSFYKDLLADPLYNYLAQRSDNDVVQVKNYKGESCYFNPINWLQTTNRVWRRGDCYQ